MRNTKRDLALIVTLPQLIKNVLLKTQERKERKPHKTFLFFFLLHLKRFSLEMAPHVSGWSSVRDEGEKWSPGDFILRLC
jgi:hypothetical protein